ncbi:MAG: fibrobacter succinogenes major paralogous domain-containing protein [Bacteroidales bacterium]|nr:fibrobacter succinogenes major paralogous domain-containing protein [Bacteroidales bacterium]MBN2699793.1 fibrobacter succinogenes major paralogous domain-containing protein [Bacteroidales bacterium]
MKSVKRSLSIFLVCVFPFVLLSCKKTFRGSIEDGLMVFGPERIVKTTGEKEFFTLELGIKDMEHYMDGFLLMIHNGDERGDSGVLALSVHLDDHEIIKPADLKKGKLRMERSLIFHEEPELKFFLDGETGSFITVTLMGWLRDDRMVDTDGNIYRTVRIGGQTWMAENLKVTRYNDGTPIPHVTDPGAWYQLSTPAYCWYQNDSAGYAETYGALYNYYAINSGRLAPAGWRVPTDEDFRKLILTLDPDANFVRHEASLTAGGKLKETGTQRWAGPNTGATNESGFSALPGGCRSYAGNFSTLGTFGYFGSSVDESSLALRFASGSAFMRSHISKYVGVSVRCVRDE